MDAAQLTQLITIGALLFLSMRFALRSLDRAEAGFASLFVPPDRTLPWPRGVQESDSPWGWNPPIPTIEPDDGEREATTADVEAALAAPPPGHSRYVETPHKVDPITVRTLPQ
jgi:hypothetical protein